MINENETILAKGKNLDTPIYNVFDGYAFTIENGVERAYPKAVFLAYKDVLTATKKKTNQEDKTTDGGEE